MVKVGDLVRLIFTDGEKPTGEIVTGTLTHLAEDEPYCEIDSIGYDLASEGHSSYFETVNQ